MFYALLLQQDHYGKIKKPINISEFWAACDRNVIFRTMFNNNKAHLVDQCTFDYKCKLIRVNCGIPSSTVYTMVVDSTMVTELFSYILLISYSVICGMVEQ